MELLINAGCRGRRATRLIMLVVALSISFSISLRAVEVTFFPASAWARDLTTLNQNLGLTNGYVFESFEDDVLEPGLFMIHANYGFGDYYSQCQPFKSDDPNAARAYAQRIATNLTESASAFGAHAWHGDRAVSNADATDASKLGTEGGRGWPYLSFRFSPGSTSVGIGLSGAALETWREPPADVSPKYCLFGGLVSSPWLDLKCVVTVNGTNYEFSVQTVAGTNWTPGLTRNGYLRIDAGENETISAVGFHAPEFVVGNCVRPPNQQAHTSVEFLGFDHVAFKPGKRTFAWVNGFCYYKTDEEGIQYAVCAGSEDWSDPCNWILDSVRGAGVPGTNDLDKVLIHGGSVGTYPTNAVGRISELLLKGHRTIPLVTLGAPDLTVLHLIDLFNAELGTPRAPQPTRIVLAETARFTAADPIPEASPVSGVGYNATLDNYGVIKPPGALKVSGRINNYGLIEFKGSELRNNCFEWSSTSPYYATYNDIVPGLIVNHGRMTKLADPGLVCFTCNLTNHPNAVFEVLDGNIDFLDGVYRQPRSLHNAGKFITYSSNTVLRFLEKSYVTATAGSTFIGPGRFVFNRLELSDTATVENGDFGQVYGPGDLTVTGLGRTLASAGFTGAAFSSPPNSSGRLPAVIVAAGARFLFPRNGFDSMGRRMENHGELRIESDFTFRSDVANLPGHVLNHTDGRLEIATKRITAFPQQADGIIENRGAAVATGPAFENSFWLGRILNSGSFEIGGGPITFYDLEQSDGSFVLKPGALVNISHYAKVSGGVLGGFGRLGGGGALDFSAVLRPGSSAGTFNLAMSHFTNAPSSTWEFEIGGRQPGLEHDQVVVEGALHGLPLAGTLRVRLLPGFVPEAGDQFHLIREDIPQRVGTFDSYDFPALPGGLQWVPRYARDGVRLVVVRPLKLDTVVNTDGQNLTLAWASNLPGPIVLEATDSLSPANWQPVTATVQDDGTNTRVVLTLDQAASGKFFRLRQGP